MSSPEDKAGRALVKTWATAGKPTDDSIFVQADFSAEGGEFGIRCVGVVDKSSTPDRLVLVCEGCELFIDLVNAQFMNVVAKSGLESLGLRVDKYGESVTLRLDVGRCVLATVPRPLPN